MTHDEYLREAAYYDSRVKALERDLAETGSPATPDEEADRADLMLEIDELRTHRDNLQAKDEEVYVRYPCYPNGCPING